MIVPAILLGIPTLFILILVALQLIGGVVWLPVARRVLGDLGLRAGPRRVLDRLRVRLAAVAEQARRAARRTPDEHPDGSSVTRRIN